MVLGKRRIPSTVSKREKKAQIMKEEAETFGFIKTKDITNPHKQNERYLQYIYLTKD